MQKYISIISFLIIISQITFSQNEEPAYEDFIKNFKKDYFTIEALFQVVGDFQPERNVLGNNGFSISNMRLRLFGNLDKNFGYFFQTNFAVAPVLLDAAIKYKFTNSFALSAGQFKTPFSKEYLTYAGSIDFVNRSQASINLSPKRDIGIQLSGNFVNNLIEYRAGIFNGSGSNKTFNDNNSFLYVGRLSIKPRSHSDYYEIGVNAGYNNNSNGRIFDREFQGKRTMLGGDFRAEFSNFLFATEFISNNLDGLIDSLAQKKDPKGYQVTIGYKPHQQHQLLFKYDNLRADNIINDSDLYIFGYNFWPSAATEVQFNYIVIGDKTNFKYHWYLINLQINL